MLVDMHLHEKLYSSDSFISIEQIVKRAKRLGLGAVCITDHDSMGFVSKVKHYEKKLQFPIFVGIEFLSFQGDITAFAPGLEYVYPKSKTSASEFTTLVHTLGGFSVACHPYRNNNRGLGNAIGTLPHLDAVEVLSGSTPIDECQKAYDIALKSNKKMVGVSDAHVEENIARFVTYIPGCPTTLSEFIKVLRESKNEEIVPVALF